MIDLSLVVTELVLRGGRSIAQDLQDNYRRNPTLPGLSVTFHPGYDVDTLARVGHFKHRTISFATVEQLQQALVAEGYTLQIQHTPSAATPEHHSLLVSQHGTILPDLPDAAAHALSQEFGKNVVPNPYQQP